MARIFIVRSWNNIDDPDADFYMVSSSMAHLIEKLREEGSLEDVALIMDLGVYAEVLGGIEELERLDGG